MATRFTSLVAGAAAAATLLAGTALPFVGQAKADMLFCWDDPLVSINGNLMDVRVEQPLQNLLTMRSTAVTVVVPANVSGAVIINDLSAFPMQTSISRTGPTWSGHGAIPVTVKVLVTSPAKYTVKLSTLPIANLGHLLALPQTDSGVTNVSFSIQTSVG